MIDGVPQWSARGADSFSPFKEYDYASMVSLNAYSSTNNSAKYRCIKDTEVLIFAVGTQYNTSGSIKINSTAIYSYDSSNWTVSFFQPVSLKAGDVVSMTMNIGSTSGYGVVAGMLHNGGIY